MGLDRMDDCSMYSEQARLEEVASRAVAACIQRERNVVKQTRPKKLWNAWDAVRMARHAEQTKRRRVFRLAAARHAKSKAAMRSFKIGCFADASDQEADLELMDYVAERDDY